MGTEILKSFGTLQSELEEAKNTLKGVDENIKRLIGRDPSELVPRPSAKRGPPNDDSRNRPRVLVGNRNRTFNHENDEPPSKRRSNSSVFKRLSERPSHYEEEAQAPQKQMISKVIVTPKEVPSRQEALAAQNSDEKFKARNRRMFGALLGTLQKFQQEETKLKPREDKRAQLEKKIEEHEIREKAEIKKERQELFLNRKRKQAEIKMIELKMLRMKEYATWEEKQKPRMNFITTKSKPHIHYLPRKLNDTHKASLEECKKDIEKMIEKRRQAVFDELKAIEDRMKRNFKMKDDKQDDDHTEGNDDDHNESHLNDSSFIDASFPDANITEMNTSGDVSKENGEHKCSENVKRENEEGGETTEENEVPLKEVNGALKDEDVKQNDNEQSISDINNEKDIDNTIVQNDGSDGV